jgi:hypothetical protein
MAGNEPMTLAEWQALQQEQQAQWAAERERQEDRRLAASGDLYELGERVARRAIQADADRHVREYEGRVRQATLAEERAQRQAAAERWAQRNLSAEDIQAAREAFEAEDAPEDEDFAAGERRWRQHAERIRAERLEREKETVVRDADIRSMSMEAYARVFDPETGRPREGVRYEAAALEDGVPGQSMSEALLAAGISGSYKLRS